jgi:hypothetical protein
MEVTGSQDACIRMYSSHIKDLLHTVITATGVAEIRGVQEFKAILGNIVKHSLKKKIWRAGGVAQ